MLAISKQEKTDACAVNILPCRINHDGPTKVAKRYWTTATDTDSTKTAHFRGRRLRGRTIKISSRYQGIVLKATNRTIIDPANLADDDEEEPEIPEPVKIVEEISTVEDLTVWGHDHIPASDNNFVRGVEEWIAFAEAIHGS